MPDATTPHFDPWLTREVELTLFNFRKDVSRQPPAFRALTPDEQVAYTQKLRDTLYADDTILNFVVNRRRRAFLGLQEELRTLREYVV